MATKICVGERHSGPQSLQSLLASGGLRTRTGLFSFFMFGYLLTSSYILSHVKGDVCKYNFASGVNFCENLLLEIVEKKKTQKFCTTRSYRTLNCSHAIFKFALSPYSCVKGPQLLGKSQPNNERDRPAQLISDEYISFWEWCL